MFYGKNFPLKHHVQVLVRADYDQPMSRLLGVIYDAGFNVVRSNLRQSPPAFARKFVADQTARAPYLDEIQYKTIDVTFEIGEEESLGQLAEMDQNLQQMEAVDTGSFLVTKRSWRASR